MIQAAGRAGPVVFIFGGALSTGGSGLAYVDFVVPGVILLAAGYGAANTALSADVTGNRAEIPCGPFSPLAETRPP